MEAISGEVLWVLALLHVPIPSFMDLEVMIVNSKCGDTLMLGHLYHSEFGRFSRDISRCESVCTLLHCPNQYKCCFNAYSAGSYCMLCCSCRHINYIAVLPDIKGLVQAYSGLGKSAGLCCACSDPQLLSTHG